VCLQVKTLILGLFTMYVYLILSNLLLKK